MIVLCDNEKWNLDMGINIFLHLKRNYPSLRLRITRMTSKSYKAIKMAEMRNIKTI